MVLLYLYMYNLGHPEVLFLFCFILVGIYRKLSLTDFALHGYLTTYTYSSKKYVIALTNNQISIFINSISLLLKTR